MLKMYRVGGKLLNVYGRSTNTLNTMVFVLLTWVKCSQENSAQTDRHIVYEQQELLSLGNKFLFVSHI